MSARNKVRPPTVQQFAAVKFEPAPGLTDIPSDRAEWADRSEKLRVVMVFACRIIGKDKAELIQAAASALASDGAWEAMIDALNEAAEGQKAIVQILEAAHVRAIVAMANATMVGQSPPET